MKKLVLQEKNNNKKEKLTLNVDHAGHWGIEYLQEHQGMNVKNLFIYLFIYLFTNTATPQKEDC